MTSLDIGCGENKRCDIGVDIRKTKSVDVVCDVRSLPFRDSSFDKTYSSHVLEHFSWREIPAILREWIRVTKPNGIFEIIVPNIRSLNVFKSLVFNRVKINDQGYSLGIIWGRQEHPYDFHKCGFTTSLLKTLLEKNRVATKLVRDEDEAYIIGLPLSSNKRMRNFYRKMRIGKFVGLIFPSWGMYVHLTGKKHGQS